MNSSILTVNLVYESELPTEIWHQVFKYFLWSNSYTELVLLKRVSTRWRDVIEDYFFRMKGLVLKRTVLFPYRRENLFEETLRLHSDLQSLTIDNCKAEVDFFRTIIENCPKLRILTLIKVADISCPINLPAELGGISDVKELYLDGCFLLEQELGDVFLLFTRLESLTLWGLSVMVYGDCFRNLCSGLQKLELDISSVTSDKSRLIDGLVSGNGKLINELSLNIGHVMDRLSQRFNMTILSGGLKNITELTLSFVTDGSYLLSSLSNLVQLESITLIEESLDYKESALNDRGLREIFTKCTELQYICLSGKNSSANRISGSTIRKIVDNCSKLEWLYLNNANNLYDEDLRYLSRSNTLKFIKVARMHFITNASLEILWSRCRELEKLRIVNCQKIDYELIFSIINLSSVDYLKFLSVKIMSRPLNVRSLRVSYMRSPINFENYTVPPNLILNYIKNLSY